jgi:hypothetical protein
MFPLIQFALRIHLGLDPKSGLKEKFIQVVAGSLKTSGAPRLVSDPSIGLPDGWFTKTHTDGSPMYSNTVDENNQPVFKFPESFRRPLASEKSPVMINMFSAEFTDPDNVEGDISNEGNVVKTIESSGQLPDIFSLERQIPSQNHPAKGDESDEESLNAPGITGHFDWRERLCSAKASSSSSQGPKSLSGKGQPSRAPVAAAASSDEQMPQAAAAPPHAVAKSRGTGPGVKRCFK